MTLPPFELDQWFATAEGRFDLSLSHSGCEPLTVADLVDEDQMDEFRRIHLAYGAFAGLDELRAAIAEQYESLTAADVLTFNGPSESIYTFMRSVLNAGDEVIVQSPQFHPLHAIARHMGCRVAEWAASAAPWEFEVDELDRICSPATRVIVINFPHNPTGRTLTPDELTAVVEIARRNDAILFSDEAFRLLELPPLEPLPAVCDLYERGVSITGLSKPYGLGGLRIGWMATKASDVLESAKNYRFNTAEMTNTPCQWLACRALEKAETIIAANRSLIVQNLQLLERFVADRFPQLKLHTPQAGTMALVEQHSEFSSRAFCQKLLEQQRVFLIPGEVLGMSDRLLRTGLGMRDFAPALQRLAQFLETEATA